MAHNWIKWLIVMGMCLHSPLKSEEPYESVKDRAQLPILTPSFAGRETSKIRLSNGLEAYLISDPQATQSGAVLTVQAGSWEDPEAYPGLAHFLEHMLFLGTEKYPIESDYDRFIRAHGGLSNAYTTSDHTLYLFSVNNQAFEEALDRFASFFKTPLFNPSGVSRELQAIDQEFSKNLNSDDIREHYVQKELSNPEHPYHRFSAGNSTTLSAVSQQVLKEWYKNHYSANLMRLIVYSKDPLDKLKALVVEDFSGIPNSNRSPLQTSLPVLQESREGEIVYIEPLRDMRTLRLTWEIPLSIDQEQIYQPETILCYVLGHEGEGSLLASLKQDNLAEELSCGGYRLGAQNLLFTLQIKLTEEGLQKINTVIARCFQAIKMLNDKPFPTYLFDEVKKIATFRYQYQSQDNPFDYLMQMGGWLAHEKLATFPEYTQIPQAFDPKVIQAFLGKLTPKRVAITVIANPKELPIPLNKKEKWMGIPYSTQQLPKEQLELWNQLPLNPALYLPEPNPFIPEKLSLASRPGEEVARQRTVPRPSTLIDTEQAKIYFYEDTYFQLPEIVWDFEIQSPLINKREAFNAVATDLYLKCLEEALKPFSYPAELANLAYEIKQEERGVILSINGYSDKAEILFDRILERLKTCKPTEAQFQLFKNSLLRSYLNFNEESALEQGIEVFQTLLYKSYVTHKQKAEAIQFLNYEQFLNYVDHLYDQTYVRGLLYGNIEEKQAHRLWNHLQSTLSSQVFPQGQRPTEQIVILPEQGPYLLDVAIKTPSNATILAIEDPLFSFQARAAQQILSQAMGSSFYATLRTKQQTGYLVFSIAEEFNRRLFSLFAVQSNTHDPRDLLARFELFIEDYLQEMGKTELLKDRFDTVREALLEKIKQPPQNLIEMGELLRTLALKYEGDFEWITKRIQGFQELTYEKFLEFTVQFLGKENKRRVAILAKGTTASPKNLSYIPLQSAAELKELSKYSHVDE